MTDEEARTAVTSPPAGTGNVPGLGETFNMNLSTGQGVYTYLIHGGCRSAQPIIPA